MGNARDRAFILSRRVHASGASRARQLSGRVLHPATGLLAVVASACGGGELSYACAHCNPGELCSSADACVTVCDTAADCGTCADCVDGLCYELGAEACADCTPRCDDRCGGPDSCGGLCPDRCVSPESCGGGGIINVCGEARGGAPCVLPWGGTVPDGVSVVAYETSSVACGSTCVSETRMCADGALSGSYLSSSCSAVACCAYSQASGNDASLPEPVGIELACSPGQVIKSFRCECRDDPDTNLKTDTCTLGLSACYCDCWGESVPYEECRGQCAGDDSHAYLSISCASPAC